MRLVTNLPNLVFVDEAGFMLDPVVRRTLAPRGQTPVITVANVHDRISVIGAMTISPNRRQFGFLFHLLPDNVNFRCDSVVEFLKTIYGAIRGPITLLWDEICIHRGSLVQRYLASHRRLDVELFPPYAPELNAVDYVWSYVKYGRLANYCPADLTQLRKRLAVEFRRLQSRPRLLESLFRRTGLELT